MRFRAAPFLILALSAARGPAQEGDLAWMPPPGRYSSARVGPSLPTGASGEYRFTENGDGIWRPLEGPLELTAFPREERTYILEVRGSKGAERFEGRARYVIDRFPPSAPTVSPPPGSYEGTPEIRLSSEPDAQIYYSLEALDRPSPGFRPYDPARPPVLDRPRDGTRAWTLSAYAVDRAGNPGPIATVRYVVEPAPTGPRADPPAKAAESVLGSGSDLEYRVERKSPGSVVVLFPVPEGGKILAAVNPRDASDPRYYAELPAAGREAALEVSAPAGWVGPLLVRYARWAEGKSALAPGGVEIRFAFEDPGRPPPAPAEPVVLYPPGTRTVLLSWDPSPFRIEVSVGSGPFAPYSLPISVPVPETSRGLEIRYRAVGPSGGVSEVRTLALVSPSQPIPPEISGLPAAVRTSGEVRPRAAPGTVVRYEASTEGFPPAVSSASPLLDEGISFPGEAGKDVRYYLRFRSFSDASPEAAGSDERFAEFLVDRSPPPAPRLAAGSLDGDTEEDRIVAFEPGEGTVRFAAVEKGSPADPDFREYTGPVTLEGSGDRPRAYDVYAYAVDEAGNRSETLGPVSVRIDRASVYVAPWGRDSDGGGPRNPLATVSAGIAAASKTGRRFVRVTGDVRLGSPVRAGTEVEILGGCDESWEPVPGRRSGISAEGESGPLFIVQGSALVLRNLTIEVNRPGDFTFAESSEGTLSVENLRIRIHATGELAVFRSRDSRLEAADFEVEISGALFARVVEAAGGETRIRGLTIRAERSLGYLTAFSFAGGSAEISRTRSECRTSGGFTLVRGVGSRFELRDSYIKARGSGYCEAFRLEESRSALYAVSADLDCAGPLTFASIEGGRMDVLHSTAVLRGGPVVYLDLKSAAFRLGNSILQDDSGSGTLVRTDEAVQRGAVVRNALSGFRAYLEGSVPAATIDALNRIAAPPDGQNFQETFRRSQDPGSFGLPLLVPGSLGLGGAYPVSIPSGDPDRPEPARKDVGAVEDAR
jgi:hypothetical protein